MTGNRWLTPVALILLGGLSAGVLVAEIAAHGVSDNRFIGLTMLQALIALVTFQAIVTLHA